MSSISFDKPESLTRRGPAVWSIGIPYALIIAAQIPLLLIYFSDLWQRPHYQFFPFALLVTGLFAWYRWPKKEEEPFFASRFSSITFWIGIAMALLGTLFVTAWFAAASFVFLVTSLLARTKDGEFPDRSLLGVVLPLLVILALPANLDFRLITWLQLISSQLSSLYLDLFGYLHYSPGTTLTFPGGEVYEIERACSGVQSFFTLLFCASVIIVVLRRGWFRGTFLMVSAVFWAVLMNSVRIVTIPIANITFGLDLKDGLRHELLGYGVMLVAVLMLLSTDQLIEYLIGGRNAGSGAGRRRPWPSRRVAGDSDMGRTPVGSVFRKFLIVAAVIAAGLGVFQIADVVRSLNNPELRVRFFDTNPIIDVDETILPETMTATSGDQNYRWRLREHERDDRKRGSDLGQRSDSWSYLSASGMFTVVSLDQPFPGWHELTTCYQNVGWKLTSLRRKLTESLTTDSGETIDWTYIEVELENPATLQRGFLLFCFCDGNGEPFEAPLEWDGLRSFYERVKNRLSYRIRENLFRGQSYQIQVFSAFTNDVSDEQKEELRNQFFEARKLIRKGLLKYRDANPVDVTTDETSPDRNDPDTASRVRGAMEPERVAG